MYGAGHVVGDHRQAVGLVGAGGLRDMRRLTTRGCGRRFGIHSGGRIRDFDGFVGLSDCKGKM